MSSQAKENMGADTLAVVADKGYYSANEFEKCENNGIKPIVSEARQTFHAVTAGYEKDRFNYNEENNCYVCPSGVLLSPGKKSKDGAVRFTIIKACRECVNKSKCTKNDYRIVRERPNEKYARIVDKQTKENMYIYHKRQMLVEHPFGTLKRALGFTYFLTRGTENVRTESVLHFLIYNMKHVINTMGMQRLWVKLHG